MPFAPNNLLETILLSILWLEYKKYGGCTVMIEKNNQLVIYKPPETYISSELW